MVTVHEVLEAINNIRLLTSPPNIGERKVLDITTIVEADNQLLDLQERLLRDYGDASQTTTLPVPIDLALHEHMLSLGYVFTHHPADGHPAYDEYMGPNEYVFASENGVLARFERDQKGVTK